MVASQVVLTFDVTVNAVGAQQGYTAPLLMLLLRLRASMSPSTPRTKLRIFQL
jgi:hypothetical protein